MEKEPQSQENIFNIKLALFEGPIDLLLYLIKKNEIDIYDIPIAQITEQFLQYIEFMKILAIDIATEYIVMAAYLIHLKSCMLLPANTLNAEELAGDEDPRMPLVRQLLAYKELQKATATIEEMYEQQKLIYFREPEEEDQKPILLEELSVNSLVFSFFEILKKKKQDILHIPADSIRMEDSINDIMSLLKRKKFLRLSELIVSKRIIEIVSLFMAILELIKQKRIKAFQNEEFSDIFIISKRRAKTLRLVKD
ncbi:MAG: hypothetical protein A2Y62_14255 [Candidatus Fischerbacteria bacterium RBG_13_37_8]|uniref:Segregation and condensation protein A n=1 Tax=Candidatus Fischerbacteria bacterium RBG_13_37_8 TaxID=1817863 RepID=A0A1F5VVS4_9BACT|nr:MAG: hypothetical protein A2Y62_14255 [Candidatus Fischerbacteria bacterium RBG_13_37_8]